MEHLRTTEAHDQRENGHTGPITRREREVAELIAQGLSNEQIAERLVLTPGTVANHVAHILAKLGARSRVHVAVEIARESGRGEAESILALLARLREIEAADLHDALQHATDVLACSFRADKVDAFLYQPADDCLLAVGTSNTPMGRRQHELGLHQLPRSNGGRVGWVFEEQRAFRDGHVEEDGGELVGVRRDLGVRSTIAVPLQVSPQMRGVLLLTSAQPDHFSESQLQLLHFVAYWVGLVAREHASRQDDDGQQE